MFLGVEWVFYLCKLGNPFKNKNLKPPTGDLHVGFSPLLRLSPLMLSLPPTALSPMIFSNELVHRRPSPLPSSPLFLPLLAFLSFPFSLPHSKSLSSSLSRLSVINRWRRADGDTHRPEGLKGALAPHYLDTIGDGGGSE